MKKLEKIKNHFTENKTVYIYGGLTATAAVLAYGVGRYSGVKQVVVTDVANVKLWSPTTTNVSVVLEELSTPSKPVYCPELKRAFNSINDAARKLNIDRNSIRKVMTGEHKQANGLSFEFLVPETA